MKDIDKFVSDRSELGLSDPKEFRILFSDVVTDEVNVSLRPLQLYVAVKQTLNCLPFHVYYKNTYIHESHSSFISFQIILLI